MCIPIRPFLTGVGRFVLSHSGRMARRCVDSSASHTLVRPTCRVSGLADRRTTACLPRGADLQFLIDDATQCIFENPFDGSKPHRQCPAQKDFDSDQKLIECSCDMTFQMDLGNVGRNHAIGQGLFRKFHQIYTYLCPFRACRTLRGLRTYNGHNWADECKPQKSICRCGFTNCFLLSWNLHADES
jgi:hypothetical protein